jgi:hypothetical protein
MSTDLAEREQAAVALAEQEAAIARQQESTIDQEDLLVPMLKVGQKLTKEVDAGNAEEGEFINTLLGEGVGDKIGFIIVDHHKGRAAQDRKANRYYVSDDFDVIPESWAPFVGDTFVGTRFDEHPDADEMFREAVNNGEREWGQGAPIKTTHIYTGYAVVSAEEGSDEEFELQPVRLSIKITNKDNKATVSTINSLKTMKLRNKPFWHKVFELSTERKTYGGGSAYAISAKLGRETSLEEREAAVELYNAVMAGRVSDNSVKAETAERAAEVDAKGGIEVG